MYTPSIVGYGITRSIALIPLAAKRNVRNWILKGRKTEGGEEDETQFSFIAYCLFFVNILLIATLTTYQPWL